MSQHIIFSVDEPHKCNSAPKTHMDHYLLKKLQLLKLFSTSFCVIEHQYCLADGFSE